MVFLTQVEHHQALIPCFCYQSRVLGPNEDRNGARPLSQRHRQGFPGATAPAEGRLSTNRERPGIPNNREALLLWWTFPQTVPAQVLLRSAMLIRDRKVCHPGWLILASNSRSSLVVWGAVFQVCGDCWFFVCPPGMAVASGC